MKKTKFLLHGGDGGLSLDSYADVQFFRECVGDILKEDINVLSVGYALDDEISEFATEELASKLKRVHPNLRFNVETALESTSLAQKQFKWADLIFIHGGSGDRLQEVLKNHKNLFSLIKNKTCAGYSAGANLWSKGYYSNDHQAVIDGLNVLQIATFCHYHSYKWRSLNTLIKHFPSIPIITLHDEEYVVLYVS